MDKENRDELMPLKSRAVRELSAFLAAVKELFGPEQAAASEEDWLRELVASDEWPATARDWRTLTIRAAARLAGRVDASAYRERRLAQS